MWLVLVVEIAAEVGEAVLELRRQAHGLFTRLRIVLAHFLFNDVT
jgi:hypothetical protein